MLVVWCPDWPIAATAEPGEDEHRAVAVATAGRILACSETARAAGVRRGQRLRLAQRLCPELELRDRDPEAETRRFEPVVAAVEAFTPRVEVLRPGLCAIPVKGPGRYFGGEESLAALVGEAVAAVLARGWAAEDRDGDGPADGADLVPLGLGAGAGSRVVRAGERAEQAEEEPEEPEEPEEHQHQHHGRGHERAHLRVVRPLRPAPGPAEAGPAGPARHRTAREHPVPASASPPRSQVGVADGLFAAVLAARAGLLVPAGRTAEFLAPYPVAALGDEPLAELLEQLGIPTVGAFAALPARAVADRFGPTGTAAHRLARGLQPRPLAPRPEGLDLTAEQLFDPPELLAEPLVFVARTLAEQLHTGLASAGLTCQRVAVEVACADGRTVSRLWRHEGRLSAAALAERVRWQLQAWQGAGTFSSTGHPGGGPAEAATPVRRHPTDPVGSPDAPGPVGFTALRLVPDGLVPDHGRQLALWGQGVVDDRVERAVARVQMVLGHGGLRRIEAGGGRGPAEQMVRVPWGEAYEPSAGVGAPWPGRLQDPLPSVVPREPLPVTVLDAGGLPVVVDGRAGVSAPPDRITLRGQVLAVTGWTGPWPAVECWWDPALSRRRARFQVTVSDGRALLLTVEAGRWFMEAAYT
ncbi:hypothetical protein [Kitasatospora sp. NPDC050543]|uniref:DNA polymerase Y family protein n=1 Tax=Kitasatospora sp. NPDC050543 TaxID=3364054 RepID=UPI0037B7AF7A